MSKVHLNICNNTSVILYFCDNNENYKKTLTSGQIYLIRDQDPVDSNVGSTYSA